MLPLWRSSLYFSVQEISKQEGRKVKEVQVNEAETEDSRPILYRVQANGILIVALFDTGASISVMSSMFSAQLLTNPNFSSAIEKGEVQEETP